MKIAYLIHPVTAEKKAEYNGKGFRILDARYAPEKPNEGDFLEKPEAKADSAPKADKTSK